MAISRSTPSTGNDTFLVGAAIGTGMTAIAAEHGGADFLLALSAGRYRVMGAPSIACMLPLVDNNAHVAQFSRAEILTRVNIPVYFGATVSDPRLDLPAFVARLRAWGFAGVANFPSAGQLGSRLRHTADRAGIGFPRELELMREAKAHGLGTLAYVRNEDDALTVAGEGVDMICLNFGWNAGGSGGMPQKTPLAEAAAQAEALFRTLRRKEVSPLLLVEGGPVTTPEEAGELCGICRADGYIGGSTIDRMPLEVAVAERTSAYKALNTLRCRIDSLKDEFFGPGHEYGLIGRSPAIVEVVRLIEKVADTDLSVLVLGANGTGKELVAQAIHRGSNRGDRDMVTVNCAALPPELIESELFGYEAGAFTSAVRTRRGRFEEANGSTIFLDEIGELGAAVQAKLLRVLESGTFERLGSNRPIHVNARVVSATNRDIQQMVRGGEFRQDLYYRLNTMEIRLPTLAERLEDIPILARYFLDKDCRALNPDIRDIAAGAYRRLMNHSWPGNVRELHNTLTRAAALGGGELIGPADLPALSDDLVAEEAARPGDPPESEREWLLEGLRRNRFRRQPTASYLGISRKTLYNKMKRYGLL
jgi:DNA-binding NtrC family response regulator/predicted TIM-barrel enzyme